MYTHAHVGKLNTSHLCVYQILQCNQSYIIIYNANLDDAPNDTFVNVMRYVAAGIVQDTLDHSHKGHPSVSQHTANRSSPCLNM